MNPWKNLVGIIWILIFLFVVYIYMLINHPGELSTFFFDVVTSLSEGS